jgi:hypothetical protein
MSELALESAKPKMAYYDRYKKEIDHNLALLPPEQRILPNAYKMVHDMVASQHMPDIIKEEVEKAIRTASQPVPPNTPTSNGRSVGGTDPSKMTFEDVFGDDAMQALKVQGKTPDQFAQRLGYKDSAEYIKFTLDQRGGSANA